MLLWLLACAPTETFDHDGMEREYLLHLPPEPEGAPLLFFLHGYGGRAAPLAWPHEWGSFQALADEGGFAVVAPQGSPDRNRTAHWNAQLELSETDDLGFLSALAEHLQSEHGLDPERTFTSGISNGGVMSYALVCQRPEVFRGMASVIGTMSGQTWGTCAPEPLRVLQISGTADETVPIDGSMDTEDGWGGAPPIAEIMAHWGEIDGCEGQETATLFEDTSTTRYVDCEGDTEVRYHEVEGLGHAMPAWDWPEEIVGFLMP